MIKFVSFCYQCPCYAFDSNYGDFCGHPKWGEDERHPIENDVNTSIASECPLRHNHLIIKFDNTRGKA